MTGTMDMDYEVEAEDKYDAGSQAEELFVQEFRSVSPWSSVEWEEAEEIEDGSN